MFSPDSVVVYSLFVVAPIVCGYFVLNPDFVSFLLLIILMRQKELVTLLSSVCIQCLSLLCN